jgi:hypothetical protein
MSNPPDVSRVEQLLEAAKSDPECFKCQEPITEFNEVRVITVWVDGERMDVWAHADHAKPDWVGTT